MANAVRPSTNMSSWVSHAPRRFHSRRICDTSSPIAATKIGSAACNSAATSHSSSEVPSRWPNRYDAIRSGSRAAPPTSCKTRSTSLWVRYERMASRACVRASFRREVRFSRKRCSSFRARRDKRRIHTRRLRRIGARGGGRTPQASGRAGCQEIVVPGRHSLPHARIHARQCEGYPEVLHIALVRRRGSTRRGRMLMAAQRRRWGGT